MDDALALIDQMRDPAFYAHDVATPVKVIQTHISFVVLTGPYAYKIKKPVELGFLDFSTLAKRKHFCDEEFRLNKEFAPDLYVAVLPIYRNGDRYSFAPADAGDAPVEFALQMHEFRQEDILLNVFDRGGLREEHFVEIAERLAHLHARAATSEAILRFGTPDAVAAMAEENYRLARRYVGVTQTQARYEETRAFTDRFFSENAQLFRDRIAAEKIRECHGDLHLNNICLRDGRIQFFDRIEFNETFKNIDVMYDLAFLIMDLQFRNHGDLANVLLNTYLEHSGDYRGAVLLPLYCCMRAYVRGKVCSILHADAHIGEAERRKAKDEAEAYFEHAWRYTQATTPALLIMSGLSGSGKSFVSRAIAKRSGAVIIRSDAVRKHLAGVELQARGRAIYSDAMTRETYAELTQLGVEIAARGTRVILDAKFDRESERAAVLAEAARQGIDARVVYCDAPTEVLKKRCSERAGDVSDATADLIDAQREGFEAFTERERAVLTSVETDKPIDYGAVADSLF